MQPVSRADSAAGGGAGGDRNIPHRGAVLQDFRTRLSAHVEHEIKVRREVRRSSNQDRKEVGQFRAHARSGRKVQKKAGQGRQYKGQGSLDVKETKDPVIPTAQNRCANP